MCLRALGDCHLMLLNVFAEPAADVFLVGFPCRETSQDDMDFAGIMDLVFVKLLGNRHRILFFKQCNSVSAANDWAKTSSNAPVASQPWNAWGLLDSKNKTVVESFIHYGRESACTLAFNSYAAASPSYTETIKSLGTITLPNGQTSMAIGYTTEALPVTGVPHCCGTCSIYFNNLQMLYWPAVHPNTACFGKPSAALNSTSTSAETAAQDQSIYATDSDGYVFTSPSIYVKFPLVSASDSCGLIGPAVTSITLAFSPWELSTYEWNSPAGTTLALDTADLPCGPWNGTNHFLPELWSNSSYYQPLMVLPSKLIDVVPTWKSCTADIFEGQDPPRTLSPAAAMVPTPKNADTHAQKSLASPSPSIPRLPLKTGAGNFQPAHPGPTPSSPSMPADPSTWDSGDSSSTSSPSKPNDPSTGDPGDPGDSHGPANSAVSLNASPASGLTQTLAGDPPVNRPLNPSVADPNDKKNTLLAFPAAVALQSYTITQGAAPVTISRTAVVYQSGSISAGGEIEAIPTDWGEGNRIASPMTVGGLTFSAIPYLAKAYGDPQIGNDDAANAAQIKDSAADNPNLVTYIAVGSHTIAVDPDAISVAGMTLKPGDPGVTIDGTPISLGSSVFVVGSRTETISPSPAAIPSQTPYVTVGGQTISIYSNAIIVDGKTLKPADPGITVDGTSVSLGSSILVVGSHTQNLILPQPTPTAVAAPSYMTVGEEKIAVAASSIVVAGHTMTPGDPAVMADGKLVSLGSSVLVVGTQTMSFTLPTAGASVSSGEGIGAMIMKGLCGIGAGIVASPTQTAGYNGTRGGNATMVFTGDAKEYSTHRFRGWVAWVGTLLISVL